MINAERQKKYMDMKTIERIKAENLEKMRAITARLKMKEVIVSEEADIDADSESYKIDPAWDSTEGLDIKKLVA